MKKHCANFNMANLNKKVFVFCAMFFLSLNIFAEAGDSDYVRTKHVDETAFLFDEGAGLEFSIGFMPFYQAKTSSNDLPAAFGYDKTLNCWLWGASFKAEYTPFSTTNVRFGLGYQTMYTYLSRDEDYYSLSSHLFTEQLFLVWKFHTEMNIVVEIHAGGGGFVLYDFGYKYDEYDAPTINKIYPNIIAGVGAQKYVNMHFFIETFWDFSYVFMEDSPFLMIQPSISAGWRF